tara:strand:- start:168 stop:1271 length:1104 start_codon:yes stop_codon:yes gene_type:complete
MSRVVTDIKKIHKLAGKVHKELGDGKISKAKRHVKKIIDLDLDEISRLQKEHGDERVLNECVVVLRDAKKALRDLDSFQLFDECKQLMDEIIAIERHEMVEVEEDERFEDELYEYWYENWKDLFFYHGTASFSIDRIKKYGLNPNMTPWDQSDMKRLYSLFKKACGNEYRSISLDFWRNRMDQQKLKGVYLSVRKDVAEGHGSLGGEMWHSIIGKESYANNDQNKAYYILYKWIIGEHLPDLNIDDDQYQSLCANARRIKEFAVAHSNLTRAEINEVLTIFRKYWRMFVEGKTVVLTIQSHAPAILEECSFLESYEKFKLFTKRMRDRGASMEQIQDVYDSWYKEMGNFRIKKRIPVKYIVKYEHIN